MLITIGGVTIKVTLDDQELQKLVDITSKGQSKRPISYQEPEIEYEEESEGVSHAQSDLDLLRTRSISQHTVVMVARKMLNIDTTSKKLVSSYPQIAEAAERWAKRSLKESYKILYVSRIAVPTLGDALCAVGLNEDNQFIILSVETGATVRAALKGLISRGLRANNVKLGVLGVDKEIEKEFVSLFPSATIQRCWASVTSSAPVELREQIRGLSMISSEKALRNIKSPKLAKYLEPYVEELTAYLDFDKKLWRVLRTLNPNIRLHAALKTRVKLVANEHEAQVLVTWECLRIQYHWKKIPVDAEQLSNLRYIKKAAAEAAGVTSNVPKRTIKRRPSELLKEPN